MDFGYWNFIDMKYQKYSGVIINRRSVKDADRFLTIFTQEEGKIDVYAKSVRSMKSKRSASLDMFSHISFEVIEKNDRRTLTHVDLINGHHSSKESLHNINRLFQIGELIDVLTAESDPHPGIYNLLVLALGNLSRFDTPEYLDRFKKKLLLELGYGDQIVGDLDGFIDTLLVRPLKTRQIM